MIASMPAFSQNSQSFDNPVILIVDDEEIIRKALEQTLQRQGYRVVTASNGESAIQILQQEPIGVIICDLRLPGISGVDVLTRAHKIQPDAIRMILTGSGDLNSVLAAVNYGQVNQILLKPWEDVVLSQTVSTQLEKYRLLKENQQLHDLTLSQHRDLTAAHQTLKQELQLGARIHEKLLVGQMPPAIQEISLEAMTIPSKEIDGDFFEFYQPSKNILDIVIGDVMGKGIPAALVGIALKSQLMHYAIPFCHAKVFKTHGYWEDDLFSPQEILTHLHVELVPKLIYLEYFASLFYGRFMLQKGIFNFIDCGSTKPIHYRAKEAKAYLLQGSNLPLGTIDEDVYQLHQVAYNTNDLFIFYSDGLTETRSPSKELYGPERLIALAEENPQASPKELLELIKTSVISFAKKTVFDDDLTLIVAKINALQKVQAAKVKAAYFSSELTRLDAVRVYINQLCSRLPGNSQLLSNLLQIATVEAFSNIVKHGYKNNPEGQIIIEATFNEQEVNIELADQGESFNPLEIHEPCLTGDQENGYGWFLIREIADHVTYIEKKSQKGWNHMHISKKIITEGHKMEISHREQNNVLIITPLAENLDALTAPDFKQKVLDLINNTKAKNVIFDLNQLQFIDSSGLGSLLSILRNLHSQGGELKLVSLNKPVRTMFELVSMHKVFEIFNTPDEAAKSF